MFLCLVFSCFCVCLLLPCVTCWERAYLLALVGDVYCIFVTFPCGILGQVWYLVASFPDLCLLSYFKSKIINLNFLHASGHFRHLLITLANDLGSALFPKMIQISFLKQDISKFQSFDLLPPNL